MVCSFCFIFGPNVIESLHFLLKVLTWASQILYDMDIMCHQIAFQDQHTHSPHSSSGSEVLTVSGLQLYLSGLLPAKGCSLIQPVIPS